MCEPKSARGELTAPTEEAPPEVARQPLVDPTMHDGTRLGPRERQRPAPHIALTPLSLPHYSRYDHANGALKSMRSHPMFQKLRAMKKQAAYGLGQSQIAANEAISGVKTDPSELKDEFKPGAA